MCKLTSSSSGAEDHNNTTTTSTASSSSSSSSTATTTNHEESSVSIVEHEGKPRSSRSSTSSSTAVAIRFAQHDRIYEIPHIDDLSENEIQDVWLSPNEMKQIKQECIALIKIMGTDNDNIFEDTEDKCCTRGLDQHTKRYMERRRIENAIRSETVLKLQPFKKQHTVPEVVVEKKGKSAKSNSSSMDVDVDQLIGDMCAKYSKIAVTHALKRAKRDAKEAKVIFKATVSVVMSPNATAVPKQKKKTKKKKTKKKKMTKLSTSSSSNSVVQKTNKKRKIQFYEEFGE